MENQHKLIKGYRDLSQEEIDIINQIKIHGTQIDALVSTVGALKDVDQRWVNIAKTHLQQGMMALVRSVAKPEGF